MNDAPYIRPLDRTKPEDIEAAAGLMANTEPWITLGRTIENTRQAVANPSFEAYVAVEADQVVGIALVAMSVPLIRGYIAALAVHADHRGRGVGTMLLTFAEQRILRDSPNVFLCVSSFNTRARTLYERNGYEYVGELKDYVIAGASELLFRKTTGPLSTFTASPVKSTHPATSSF